MPAVISPDLANAMNPLFEDILPLALIATMSPADSLYAATLRMHVESCRKELIELRDCWNNNERYHSNDREVMMDSLHNTLREFHGPDLDDPHTTVGRILCLVDRIIRHSFMPHMLLQSIILWPGHLDFEAEAIREVVSTLREESGDALEGSDCDCAAIITIRMFTAILSRG